MRPRGEDDQVGFGERIGQFAGLSGCPFLFRCVDDFRRRVDAHLASMMLVSANAGGDVALARPGPAISTTFSAFSMNSARRKCRAVTSLISLDLK